MNITTSSNAIYWNIKKISTNKLQNKIIQEDFKLEAKYSNDYDQPKDYYNDMEDDMKLAIKNSLNDDVFFKI